MHALPTRLAVPLAAILAAGCALAPGGHEREAPWRELESPGFLLATDLHPQAARDLVAELERIRALLVAAMFGGGAKVPGQVRVVAFARRSEYAARTGGGFAGLTVRGGDGPPRVVLPGVFDDAMRLVIAHELVHVLSSRALPRQPRWLAEGLAQHLAPVALSAGRPEVGAPPPNGADLLRRASAVSAQDALLWRWDRDLSALYAKSWALVAFLSGERPERLRDLRERLRRAEEPARAWNAVFPEWRLDVGGATEALDRELARWAAGGRGAPVPVEVEVERRAVRVAERRLAPADQRVLRAEVALVGAAGDAGARARVVPELDRALAEDPGHVGALALRASLVPEEALPLARRAVEAHPGDARGWSLLARALPAEAVAERETALRRAVALAPDAPGAAAELAAELVRQGRPAEALPIAARAAGGGPWDCSAHEVHAAALAALDRCPDALAAARRAVEVAWEVPDDVQRRARATLVAVERRCAAGP